jgi:hypothetical protein
MNKLFAILFLLPSWFNSVKAQVNASSENAALTFFIDSILPDLPQHDSTLYIQKKSHANIAWGVFYSGISMQPLSQSDSIMLKHFNDSLLKNSFYWKSNSEMITKSDDQNILNAESRLKVHYLNRSDRFQYLEDNDFKKHKYGYYISLMNSVHLYNLSIAQVSLAPLRWEYGEPLTYSGDPRSYYIFLNKDNKVLRYYEFVNYPKNETQMNWR